MERAYLDVCSLKRPFDDQSQVRIRREARGVAEILERAQRGEVELVSSPAHLVENDANPREDRRLATALWLDGGVRVESTDEIEPRARALEALGFGVLDALHLAFGEAAAARWFVTCDNQLLRLAARHAGELRIEVVDPCDPRLRGGAGS